MAKFSCRHPVRDSVPRPSCGGCELQNRWLRPLGHSVSFTIGQRPIVSLRQSRYSWRDSVAAVSRPSSNAICVAMKRVHLAEWGNWTKLGANWPFLTGIFRKGLPGANAAQLDGHARAAMKSQALSPSALFDGHLPSEAATAAVMAHPRFAEAGRIVAAGLVALYQGERVVNLVMPDRIRYIISVFAMHLHFAGRPNDPNSGLTASRLARLCVERKICSEGRAEAMLAIMRDEWPPRAGAGRSRQAIAPAGAGGAIVRVASKTLHALLRCGGQSHAGRRRCARGARRSRIPAEVHAPPRQDAMPRDFTTSSMFRTSGSSTSAMRAAKC